ncbi:MAG TPA: acylphosphatase [Thermoplasmataceae archaeon]|nr:acylphosphatase [Thermoplasmatales archaeon AK]HLH86242.1 acylphosphatase [Thermoplasmataceae archaeon]
MKTHVVIFRGRVQGVNFRRSFAELARLHSVRGTVENLPDGSVRACLQGDPEEIAELLGEARSHIRAARIDSIEETTEDMGEMEGFRILG